MKHVLAKVDKSHFAVSSKRRLKFRFSLSPVVKIDILSYLLLKIDRKLKQFFSPGS